MFILFPLTLVGIITFVVHRVLWDSPVQRGNQMLEDFRISEANESNEEDLAKIKKLNLK